MPVSALPYSPVCELVAFIRVDVAEDFEQVIQGVSAQVERASGLVSVEHVDHVEAEVFLQPLDIRVGAMEDLHGQKGTERERTDKFMTGFQRSTRNCSSLHLLSVVTS